MTMSLLLFSRRALCRRSISSSLPSSSLSSLRRLSTTTLAILQETYNPWERRAPLAPQHVQELLAVHSDLKILVQPCDKRVFSNDDYARAGAILTSDVSPADVLLGVKRPSDPETFLIENKSYIFFSHTIKGQLENMALLQTCLEKQIQLLDWERMLLTSPPDGNNKRAVSFGRFAGMAGVMDTWNALGRKLLYSHQTATALLHCPPSWMHASVEAAKEAVRKMGEELAQQRGVGLDRPLVIAVTGSGGCVHKGAMEILKLVPHEILSVKDLPHRAVENKIYLVPVGLLDFVQRVDGLPFDREDFQNNPNHYRSLFHKKVAPHVDAIVNCVYWDARFPRLLTKKQMKRLASQQGGGVSRLLLVSDISCDVNGSIEFLEKSTTIESPFFQYDPMEEKVIGNEISEHGITMMGVSILPTELPRDSTLHFGQAAMPVIHEIVRARSQQDDSVRGVDVQLLRDGLATSCITTTTGTLERRYRYLEAILERKQPLGRVNNASMMLSLHGHLFDSGLINQVLDVIERNHASMEFEDIHLCQRSAADVTSVKSTVLLKVEAANPWILQTIYDKIDTLVTAIEPAAAQLKRVDRDESDKSSRLALVQEQKQQKRVLVLGAGHVSKSVVDYLGRHDHVRITVASEHEVEAQHVAAVATNSHAVGVDVLNDRRRVSELIEDSDVVVSLLPAPMHASIAEECILHTINLVTASYESDEIRKLQARATNAGIVIINEVGLDPGLDHMSAMAIIDDVKRRGGLVTRFSSVCGGLPSPEYANDPFKYKFSWSPRGVIRASQNSAKYLSENRLIEIPGHALLQSAVPFNDAFTDLDLEVLPNRNALAYQAAYGIEDVHSIFRGTLRYRGFSSLMNVLQNMGLFSDEFEADGSWKVLIEKLRQQRGGFASLRDFVLACADEDANEADRAMDALDWLGAFSDTALGKKAKVVDAFCSKLEERLQYGSNEHDMVAMHHTIDATFPDHGDERHLCSLLLFGDSKHSAMSKTVGYTTAAAVDLILNGQLREERGLLLPTKQSIYRPILIALEKEGIAFDERVISQSMQSSLQHPSFAQRLSES